MNRSSEGFYPIAEETSTLSGVSWGAIFAGAAAAAALSLILLLLGVGLGFSAVSPWANEGVSAKGLGISTIVWLAATQIVASGLGGYIAACGSSGRTCTVTRCISVIPPMAFSPGAWRRW
jgi:hypothetical protein